MVAAWIALGALAGCRDDVAPPPPIEALSSRAVYALVGSGAGAGEVEIPVRLVNSYWAAVPGDPVTVRVEGALTGAIEEAVTLDALGVGALRIAGAPEALSAAPVGAGADVLLGDAAPSWITGGEAALARLTAVHPQDQLTERIFGAARGSALIRGSEVYWQPAAPGLPGETVAILSEPIRGSWDADIDADGQPDLVVWNQRELLLLRGHHRVGFVWGMGCAVTGAAELEWVAVGDADGDGAEDLALLFEESGIQEVVVLAGDGVWNFEVLPALPLDGEDVSSVAAGRHNGSGATVATFGAGDTLRQYAFSDGGWVASGSDLTLGDAAWSPASGTYLGPSRDISGDGAAEVFLFEPIVAADAQRELTIIDFGAGPIKFTVAYDAFHEAWADLDGDGLRDMVLAEGGAAPQLSTIAVSDSGGFIHTVLGLVDAAGPVAAGDIDGDGVPEIIIVDQRDDDLYVFPGQREDGDWSPASPHTTVWNLDAVGPTRSGDLDGDGRADVAAARLRDGRVSLSWLRFGDAQDGALDLTTATRVDVDGADAGDATALDIAVCGEIIYGLIEDAGARTLYALPLGDDGEVAAASVAVSGDRVTCGALPGGAAVAVGGAGEIVSFDASLNAVDQVDDDAADLAGAGGALFTCEEAGCSVAAAEIDGEAVGLTGDGVAAGWGAERDLLSEAGSPASGLADFVDLDGDGWPDAQITDPAAGRLAVAVGLSGALGPTQRYAWAASLGGVADRPWAGPLAWGDVDGDGALEALTDGGDGTLLVLTGR